MSNKLTDQIRPLLRSALTGGAAGSLDGIVTVGLTPPLTAIVCASVTAYVYQLRAGTDAEASPTIIRPDDYNGSTNAKVWELQAFYLSGAVSLGSSFALTGIISPTAITTDQNDYAPTGLSGAAIIRISNTAGLAGGQNLNITGLTGGAAGRLLIIENISTKSSASITLKANSSSSSAANRFGLLTDVIISPNGGTAWLVYDSTASLWRPIGQMGATTSWPGLIQLAGDLGGTSLVPTVSGASAAFYFRNPTTPSQITSDQNNYNPSSTSNTWRISSDAARSITGILAFGSGAFLLVYNVGSFPITFANQSASSSANNRFDFGEDVTLPASGFCILSYDVTVNRWRLAGAGVYLQKTGGTISGNLTVQGTFKFSKLQEDLQSVAFGATTNIDMSSYASIVLGDLTGNITFTTSNRAVGRAVKLYLKCDATPRTFTFPSWIWPQLLGAPTGIAAGKHAILTLECVYGTADTDIVATYSEEA